MFIERKHTVFQACGLARNIWISWGGGGWNPAELHLDIHKCFSTVFWNESLLKTQEQTYDEAETERAQKHILKPDMMRKKT